MFNDDDEQAKINFYKFIYPHVEKLPRLEYTTIDELWTLDKQIFRKLVVRYMTIIKDDKFNKQKYEQYKEIIHIDECMKHLKVWTRQGQSMITQLRTEKNFLNCTKGQYIKNPQDRHCKQCSMLENAIICYGVRQIQ